ncbi:MAG: DUF3025 domain-containing protein [Burkholderiales bacterium]|nr:DUF3025 domain-containing protein [Burkholderiales bacterium]
MDDRIAAGAPGGSAPTWDHDFARRSPLFAPLEALAQRLPAIGWPNTEVLDHVAAETGRRIVNARGERVRFVPASRAVMAVEFESATFERAEVGVRPIDWHDLLNALAWMTFPTAKAALNARHGEAIAAEQGGPRSSVRDALTHFDEDGVIVLSADPALSALLREFSWKELFWRRRAQVQRCMRFLVFGHALYEKALRPFVGMTGKALLFDVPVELCAQPLETQRAHADRVAALHLLDPGSMQRPRVLQPLPVLGVPGWWPESEREDFYDDSGYFRPGRQSGADTG